MPKPLSWVLLGGLLLMVGSCDATRGTRPEVTLPSGLRCTDLVIGMGPILRPGMMVSVHYTGWLEDGTKFDSSLDHEQPFEFLLGARQVIEGWEQGIPGMRVGGLRKLVILPDLGYGSLGYPGVIPPNATLVFDVRVISIRLARSVAWFRSTAPP